MTIKKNFEIEFENFFSKVQDVNTAAYKYEQNRK